ncbi:hypothetical protein DSM100238_1604 [Bifidobacterium apri]|uniref:Uncharacterized protein n=1 Tax=Bifidobacterium apri TaxID=1769423 RepID=A0A6A2WCE2_9BIFI|nr:hypothetical protein DSM100238_1604 [Bifidobacterium apri]
MDRCAGMAFLDDAFPARYPLCCGLRVRCMGYSTVFSGTSMPLPNFTSRAAATLLGRP